MCIVQVIGRADAHILHGTFCRTSTEQLKVAIEALKLSKKSRLGEVLI